MYCLALNVLKGELCLESGANCAAIYEKMQVNCNNNSSSSGISSGKISLILRLDELIRKEQKNSMYRIL